MLAKELLAEHFDRKVQQWSQKDVEKWFEIHQISVRTDFSYSNNQFDGLKFISVGPKFLMNQCGIGSKIVVRKILEWIQIEVQDFNQYIEDRKEQNKSQQSQNQQPTLKQISNNELENENSQQITKKIHFQSIKKFEVQKKVINKKLQIEELISNQRKHKQQKDPLTNENIKFAQSNYQMQNTILILEYQLEKLNGNEGKREIIDIASKVQNSAKIGRCKSNQICMWDTSVSRNHAEIFKKDNQFYIKDLGSLFGTFIEISQKKQVFEGDFIAFDHQNCYEIVKIKTKNKIFDMKLRSVLGQGSEEKDKNNQFQSHFDKRQVKIIIDPHQSTKKIHSSALFTMNTKRQIEVQKIEGDLYLKLEKFTSMKVNKQSTLIIATVDTKIRFQHVYRPLYNQ